MPVGYYKDAAKTAATFVEIDGERWALPGDMARVEADGTITVLGRGSVSINSGGEKIYPEEVELALKSHPDVFDVVVVGVPDDRWGERVVAVVKARPGAIPDAGELAEHARGIDRGLQGAAGDRGGRRDGAVARRARPTTAGRRPPRWPTPTAHRPDLTARSPVPVERTAGGDAAHPRAAVRRRRRRGARLRRDLRAPRRAAGPVRPPDLRASGSSAARASSPGSSPRSRLARYADRGYTRLLLRGGLAVAAAGMLWFGLATAPLGVRRRARCSSASDPACSSPRPDAWWSAGPATARARRSGGSRASRSAGSSPVRRSPRLIAGVLGLHAPFIVFAIALAITSPAVARLEEPPVEPQGDKRVVRLLLRRRGVLAGLALGAALFLSIGVFDAMWAKYMSDLGASTAVVAVHPRAVRAPRSSR